MATHDYNLANQDGASFRSDLNNALAAIVSNNSSSTAPATTFAHQIWVDTTANVIKQRNAANDAWVELWRIDGGFNAKTFSSNVTLNAQSDLRFADSDSSNWVAFQAPATVASNVTWTLPSADGSSGEALTTNGSGTLSWASASADAITEGNTSAEVVDTGSDGHFKVITEGTEALRVNASQQVGIGTASPVRQFELSQSGSDNVYLHFSNGAVGFTTTDGTDLVLSSSGDFVINQRESKAIKFQTNNTERARIDSSGRLLVGTSNELDANMTSVFRGSSGSGNLMLARQNAPADGQSIAAIYFADNQGNQGAVIDADRDGGTWTQGSSHPTRLIFSTAGDGATSPSERARITQAGYFKASNAGSSGYTSTSSINHEFGQSANSTTIFFRATNTSYSSTIGVFRCSRAATSDYFFIACQSSNGSDNEFLLKGDGNASADGSWSGGGADYAEYFEWSDGNTTAEDRRGISVVLDGDKIREAVAGEEPIGVISGNPSVVGDSAWNKWNGKYLRDDFGSYILNAEGERQLNPDYDPDVEYIPREDRPEWDCVGLMGKLRIRKGQVTGARWIKMRDISNNVEEWLVR